MTSIQTFNGVAHPWLCDVMGHLNTRHYMAMFDDAAMHFLTALGYDFAKATTTGKGWADVKVDLELLAEVPKGGLVIVRSEPLILGNSSLTYVSKMSSVDAKVLHAQSTTKTVFFDMTARKSCPIPPEFRAQAEGMIAR